MVCFKTDLVKEWIMSISRTIAAIAVLALAAGLTPLDVRAEAAPDFSLKDLKGLTHTLSDYKGKVLFINFWATWCPPCREEIPDFIAATKEYSAEGLVILGVSVDRLSQAKLADWVKKAEINYPVTFTTPQMTELYKPGPYIPSTIVVDKTGRIRHRHVGVLKKDELVKMFKELAAE